MREGCSGGGLCFGYSVIRESDAGGEAIYGGPAIDEANPVADANYFKVLWLQPKSVSRLCPVDPLGVPPPTSLRLHTRVGSFSPDHAALRRAVLTYRRRGSPASLPASN